MTLLNPFIFLQMTFSSIHTVGAYSYTPLRELNNNDVDVDINKNSCCEWAVV